MISDAQIVGMVRNDFRVHGHPFPGRVSRPTGKIILVVESRTPKRSAGTLTRPWVCET